MRIDSFNAGYNPERSGRTGNALTPYPEVQRQVEQQQGLYPGRQIDITPQPVAEGGRLHQRCCQRQQVDAKQNAQHDAEITEVRQGLSAGVLLYTWHPDHS